MRVLLIDNYDSFAWNLVQALRGLGAEVVVRRNDAVTVSEALAEASDAVVLSPGPCTPAEAGISIELVRAAADRGLPLLGVCLGHQAIGAAFGGRVERAPRLRHGKSSRVYHDGVGVFAGQPQGFEAMRYHSLAVAEPLPEQLVRSAWTEPRADGRDDPVRAAVGEELMALRHRDRPIIGVQFHPESYRTRVGPALLEAFLRIACASTEKRSTA